MGFVAVGTVAWGRAAEFSSTFSCETIEGSVMASEGFEGPGAGCGGLGIIGLLC